MRRLIVRCRAFRAKVRNGKSSLWAHSRIQIVHIAPTLSSPMIKTQTSQMRLHQLRNKKYRLQTGWYTQQGQLWSLVKVLSNLSPGKVINKTWMSDIEHHLQDLPQSLIYLLVRAIIELRHLTWARSQTMIMKNSPTLLVHINSWYSQRARFQGTIMKSLETVKARKWLKGA